LEKLVQHLVKYSLKFRMTVPEPSKDLRFRDKMIAVEFTVGDQSFTMRFDNLGDSDVKILWERSQYSDANGLSHRIMPSTVRFPDRNNPLPDQIVLARGSVQEAVTPVDSVFLSPQRQGYDIHPLFPLESDQAAALKGKSFSLFLPVEVDRVIIPYSFTFEITDAAREAVKN
jgi:hypothetical protein